MSLRFVRSIGALSIALALLAIAARAARAADRRTLAPGLPAPADSIRGVVRDSAGQPLDGATVTIAELGRTTTVSADGAFAFGDVAPGRYTLVVHRLGYAAAAAKVSVPQIAPAIIALSVSAIRLAPVTVTGTRAPISPMESPLPITDVGAERVRRDATVSLAHALDGVAGVRDITTGQQVGTPVVRGLSGPSVLVLDGGMRLEDYSWSTEDGPSVDPRAAENVEVVRGPASVLYGSNAIGGVINVIAPDVPEARGRPSFVHAGGEVYGATNNGEVGGAIRLEGAGGTVGWLATVIGRKAGNFHTPTGNPETPTGDIYDTGYGAVNGNVALGLHGENASGTLRYAHYGGNYGLLDGPPVPDDNTGGPLRKLSDDRLQLTTASYAGPTRLEASVQWQRHSLEEVVGDSRAGTAPPPIDLLLETTTADLLLHHASGPWLTGTVGASGMHQSNSTMGLDPLVPNATTWDASLFAFEQATKGQWSLLVGLRGDGGRVSADSNTELALSAQTRNAAAITGDVGAVFRPVTQMAIAFNVGRAYRAPTLLEYFANGPLPAEGQYVIGLPTAAPEVSLDLDASVRWQTATFSAALSVYRNQVDNYLFLQPRGDSIGVPNDAGGVDTLPVYQYVQTRNALVTGLDLSAEWAATPALSLRGRFDLVDGTNNATHAPLGLIPPPRLDVEAEVHTPETRAFYVSLGAHFVARQTRLGPFDTPTAAYALIECGAGAWHRFGSRTYQVDLRIANAANTAYTDFLSRYKTFAYGQGRNLIFRVSTPM